MICQLILYYIFSSFVMIGTSYSMMKEKEVIFEWKEQLFVLLLSFLCGWFLFPFRLGVMLKPTNDL